MTEQIQPDWLESTVSLFSCFVQTKLKQTYMGEHCVLYVQYCEVLTPDDHQQPPRPNQTTIHLNILQLLLYV